MFRNAAVTALLLSLTGFSLCHGAGMTIGKAPGERISVNGRALFNQDIEGQCTRQVRSTRGDTLAGLNCKLQNTVLHVFFLISDAGIRELESDKEAAANLEILAAEMKKNTCMNPKTFSNGQINKVIYNYVDSNMDTVFSFDVSKSDCAMRAFRHN